MEEPTFDSVKEKLTSPYEAVLEEIEKGKVNPFDIDIDYLIELFREKAEELQGGDYLIEAALFLQESVKLLKLKIQSIFPKSDRETRKITIREVKDVLEHVESKVVTDVLDWLYDYSPPIGRPRGSHRVEKPKKAILAEFLKKYISPYRIQDIDWEKESKRVYEQIKIGEFKIRNWKDLIAFLYAYMEYEDFEIKCIEEIL